MCLHSSWSKHYLYRTFQAKKWTPIVQSRLVRWDPKYLGEHKIYEIWSRWSLQNIRFSLQSAGDDHQDSDKEAITRLQRCFGRPTASGGHRWSFRKEVHRCGSSIGTIGSAAWREIQKYRMHKNTNAEIQKYTIAEMYKHRIIEILKYKSFRKEVHRCGSKQGTIGSTAWREI